MTTPYVTGTVSVTAGSAIVTGAGTGWQTAGLVAGVFGLDSANGNPIPVLSVDSDTQITLAKPWRGTTASGQAYWITYDTTAGQQTVSIAQRLAEYIARLDKPSLAALASLIPVADKLPWFGPGGAGALADFPAAARALLAGGVLPNAQLPSRLAPALTNVTASVNDFKTQGWSYFNNIAPGRPFDFGDTCITYQGNDQFGWQEATELFGGRTARRFNNGGAFGAWLLTTPPERGSNANGEYVRFSDGTQICWGNFVGYTAYVIKGVATAASFSTAIKPCFVSVTPFGAPDASPEAWSDAINGLNFRSSITSTTNRVDYCVIGRWF